MILCSLLLFTILSVRLPKPDRRTAFLIGVFSILLAVASNYGSRIFIGNFPYTDLMDTSYVTAFGIIDAIGIPVMAVVVYRSVFLFIGAWGKISKISPTIMRQPCREIPTWLPAILIFVCWLPYLVLYYPGIILGDSTSQIYQAIGDTVLSNHHPVAHTLLIRACIQLGALLGGDLTFGCAVYSVLQMVLLSLTLGMMLSWLSRRHVSQVFLIAATFFFAVLPFFGGMSIAMWKDPLFGASAIVLTLETYDYVNCVIACDQKGQIKRLAGIAMCALVFVFIRNNGFYALLVVMLAVSAAALRKADMRKGCIRLLGVLLPAVCVYKVITGPVYTYCKVQPSEKVESVGLFLNQMASVAAADGVMSDSDREYMNYLLPIGEYREKYRPCVVDCLKWDGNFNGTYLSEHMKEFYRTYVSLAIKNSGKYLNAWALQTFGYWAPNYWQFNESGANLANGNFGDLPNSSLDITQNPLSELPRTGIYAIFSLYGTILSLGIVDWIMLFAGLVMLIRKNTAGCISLTFSLGIFATMLIASPYYYWQRYGTAQYYLLPVYLYFIASQCQELN